MAKFPLAFLFDKKEDESKVANIKLFSYAAGLTGQNMTYGYISSWLSYFCINILHINERTVGLIFGASYVWDAINDPIVGAYIDRRKHKPYAKLRPLNFYLPPIIGALTVLMFLDTGITNHVYNIIYILIIYFIWDIIYSFQDIALWGMVALSSPSSTERSRVSQWVSIGAGAGGAVVGLFQMLRDGLNGMGVPDSVVFMSFAVFFGLGGELLSMSAHRLDEKVQNNSNEESMWKSLSVLRYNKTLLLISLARFSQSLSPKIQNAYFFENKVTFISGKTAEFLFGLFSGIPGSFAMFFANKIATRIGGMKKLLILSQVAAIVIRVIAFFVGYNSWGQFIVMCLLFSLVNLPGYLMDIAHRSLTSDSIDEVELKTGQRTEGVSFAMQNFVSKMNSGMGKIIEGFILSALKYDSYKNEARIPQGELFLKWQWPMFILGPIVGAVLYLITISFVRDSTPHREEVERLLRQKREEIAASAAVSEM